jgi:hypothetical protein
MAMEQPNPDTFGSDWWTDNAPPPIPAGATPNPTGGGYGGYPTPSGQAPPTVAQPGSTANWQGGGWENPRGSAIGLQKAFQLGLKGQAAVDWATANGYPGIAFYADKNQYGLPDGQYIAPNPSNPNTFDLIQRTGTEGGPGGGNPTNPGALPETPFGGIGSTPSPYVAPTWTGGPAPTGPTLTNFTAPTQAELEASPGFQSRLAAGLLAGNRSAAAQGTVLSGGTQQALARYGQDYASNEYSNLFGQKLAGVQSNNATAETGFGNAFQTYQQNYGNFMNSAAMGKGAYDTNVSNTRNAGNDYWQHLNDLYQTGAGLAGSSYKPSNVP